MVTCSSCGTLKLFNNNCVASCPASTYENTTTKTCLNNPANCAVATNDTGVCTTAATGYYLDSSSQVVKCSTTISNCGLCSFSLGVVTCSSCLATNKLYQNACFASCPALTYEITASSTCTNNSPNCLVAATNTGVC